MPILKASRKDLRKSKRRRAKNLRRLTTMRRAIKEVIQEKTPATLTAAYKSIDKARKSGVIKSNTAARRKSRLARLSAGK